MGQNHIGAVSVPSHDADARPGATTREPAPVQTAFTPAGGEGLDAMGLLLGSDLVRSAVRPVLFGLTGLLVGYLYGRNRTLERMVRRA